MKGIDDVPNTDRINFLHVGLILLSCAVAFFVPFELFLFSYAILGPAHYLTEISWLHERKYFTAERFDFVFLVFSCVILFLIIYILPELHIIGVADKGLMRLLLLAGGIASLCMIFLKRVRYRFIAFIVICVGTLISKNTVLLFALLIPTLVHVYVFTGLFMLYGAMKSRSKSGYLAFAMLLVCPVAFLVLQPTPSLPSDYALNHYAMFQQLNAAILNLTLFNFDPGTPAENYHVYYSSTGVALMRFIAFAYTYHYLNWFFKTSIIGWHRVSKYRLAIIGSLWLGSVLLYILSYEIGFYVLLLASLLHVFLEFPLNRITLTGIFSEAATMMRGDRHSDK